MRIALLLCQGLEMNLDCGRLPFDVIIARMSEKIYFTYQHIHETVKSLAMQITNDGYTPDVIVAIGTGGFIPARIMKTFLSIPILTVGIRYYDEDNIRSERPEKVQWIDEVERKLTGKKILLVDEVDDSRVTLSYCLEELLRHKPVEIVVAVIHNKLKEKEASFPEEVKRYYCGEELPDVWICYPWDAEDIAEQDRMAGK
jgi:hypoxanthine phosphoribosyltransferase